MGVDEQGGVAVPEGIEVGSVENWFRQNLDETEPPLTFKQVSGGRSNLTYRVEDAAGHAWALRRPPLGPRLQSAHDMGREYRIISALHGSPVPVAKPRGHCEDEAVTGAPFYVMDFLSGPILRNAEEVEAHVATADRSALTEKLVTTLAAIHAVEPDAVGLGDLGRHEGYVERQLSRWLRQWQAGSGGGEEGELVRSVHERLAADVPEQGPARIVHGDYRLDNLILNPDASEIAAVVDWELCTLGDPLADLGLLTVYWAEPEDQVLPLGSSPTQAEGFPGRAEIARLYEAASGRDLSRLDFYVAFGYWKLAIILQGVVERYAAGQYGAEATEAEAHLARVIGALLGEADRTLA